MSFRFVKHGLSFFFTPDADHPDRDDDLVTEMSVWLHERFGPEGKKPGARWRVHPPAYGQGEYLPPFIEMTDETEALETRLRWC